VYSCSELNHRITILATEEATGHQLWRSANVFGCVSLASTPGVVITSGNGVLTALRSTDGSMVWQVHDGVGSLRPTIMGTAVYTNFFASPDESSIVVHARSWSDGKLRWHVSVGNYPMVEAAADNIVLVENGTAIVALRGSDGRDAWSFPRADDAFSRGVSPGVATIVDGVVLLQYTTSSQIVALDLQRGSFYWQTTL
jgi:outer membrane protein assembly factor BamB